MPIIKPTPEQKALEVVKNLCTTEIQDEVKTCCENIDKTVLDSLVTNDVYTSQMNIGIEILASEINNPVPVGLPDSVTIENEVERQKTWGEYCTMGRKKRSKVRTGGTGTEEDPFTYVDGNEYLLSLGDFDEHGNRTELTWEQAKIYYNQFPNILAPKEFKILSESEKYKPII